MQSTAPPLRTELNEVPPTSLRTYRTMDGWVAQTDGPKSRLGVRRIAEVCLEPGADTEAMALFTASAEAAMDNGEDEMAEFYAAAAAAVNEASLLPAGGNSLADYGFAENVGPADFPVVEEEDAESDDAEESGASRLSARRVAGIMSPTNEFEQSRLHAGRRAAEVMSPLGAGDDETMAHFYEAAEAAAVSGDGEMAFFYAAAAAAATITGGAKAGAYFGSLANGGHVDDATEVEDEPVRTSRLGRRQVAGADGTTGSLLNKRREAETLGVSGLRRKNVDTGPMPLDITAADMAELMSQQIAQNTTVEMVELAQQMALSTLGDIGQQAEEGARKSPLSPHQSPRSPGRKAGGSRRKSGGQENMTSPKSARKSFENFQPSSPKGGRKSFDVRSPPKESIIEEISRNSYTSPRKDRRRSSIDPTGGIASPPMAEKLNILPGGHLMHDVTV